MYSKIALRIPTCLALVLVLAPPAAAAAGELEEKTSLQKELEALEGRLLQSVVDRDAEALGRLIGPGFEYTRASGEGPLFALGAEKWQQAALGYGLAGFEIHETQARRIGDEVAQTLTRTTLERGGGEAAAGSSQEVVTSTWLRDAEDGWKIVARVAVELGGGGGQPDREAPRRRFSGGRSGERAGGAEGSVDREGLRRLLGEMDEAEREALRQKWQELLRQRAAASGEEAEGPPPNGG